MAAYLLKRLILAVFTLLTILLLSYILLRLAPGDPTRSTLLAADGAAAGTIAGDRDALAKNESMRRKLHLDEPIAVGFCCWLRDVVQHGDFGTSAAVDPGRPVTELVLEKLPVTLKLNFFALLVTCLLAIPIGIWSAVNADSRGERAMTFGLFFLYSLPAIWVGLLLQALFCEGGRWPVFPLKGLLVEQDGQLSTWAVMGRSAMHYVLPVFCLSYAGFAGLSRYARSGMLEVLQQDYIRTARAKGAGEFDVIFRHGFRNAAITLITLFSGLLPGLAAGSVIVEYVFNIPGMGLLSLAALSSRDYPLQMALFAFAALLTLGGILLSDLLYVLADPRISLTGKSRTR